MEEMEKYDKTTFDPGKAFDMARDTFSKLLQARNLMAASGRFGRFQKPIPFEAIEDKVREFALAADDKKGEILRQIQYVITHYFEAEQGWGKRKPPKKRTRTKVSIVD
jgi:hypothetical protein